MSKIGRVAYREGVLLDFRDERLEVAQAAYRRRESAFQPGHILAACTLRQISVAFRRDNDLKCLSPPKGAIVLVPSVDLNRLAEASALNAE